MAGPRGGLVVGVLAALLAASAGPASERVVITSAPNGAREEIPVAIDKPEGPGPFPAGFAAAVALYPGGGIRLGAWRANGSGTYRPVARC